MKVDHINVERCVKMRLILLFFFAINFIKRCNGTLANRRYLLKSNELYNQDYDSFSRNVDTQRSEHQQPRIATYVNEDSDVNLLSTGTLEHVANKRYAIKRKEISRNFDAPFNGAVRRNLVQFRDSSGRVIATLADPRNWNDANVTLSKHDDARRLIESMKGLFGKKHEVDLPTPRLYKQEKFLTKNSTVSIISEDDQNYTLPSESLLNDNTQNVSILPTKPLPNMKIENLPNMAIHYYLKMLTMLPTITVKQKVQEQQNSSTTEMFQGQDQTEKLNENPELSLPLEHNNASKNLQNEYQITQKVSDQNSALNLELPYFSTQNNSDENKDSWLSNSNGEKSNKSTSEISERQKLKSDFETAKIFPKEHEDTDRNKTFSENGTIPGNQKHIPKSYKSNDAIDQSSATNLTNPTSKSFKDFAEQSESDKDFAEQTDFYSGDVYDISASGTVTEQQTSGDNSDEDDDKPDKRNYGNNVDIGDNVRHSKLEMNENDEDHNFIEDIPDIDISDGTVDEHDDTVTEETALNHDTKSSVRPENFNQSSVKPENRSQTTLPLISNATSTDYTMDNNSLYNVTQEETKRLEIYGADGQLDMIEESNTTLPVKTKLESILNEDKSSNENPTQSIVITNKLYETLAHMKNNQDVTMPDITGEQLYEKFESLAGLSKDKIKIKSVNKKLDKAKFRPTSNKHVINDLDTYSDTYYYPENYGNKIENSNFNQGVNTDVDSSKHFKIIGSIDPLSNVEYNNLNLNDQQNNQYYKDQIIKDGVNAKKKQVGNIIPYDNTLKKTLIPKENEFARPEKSESINLETKDKSQRTDVFQAVDKRDIKTPDDYFDAFDEVDPVNKDVSMVTEVDSNEITKRSKILKPHKKKSKKISSKEAHKFLHRKAGIEYPSEDVFFHRAIASHGRHSEEHSLYRNNPVRNNIFPNSNEDEINEISEILDDNEPTKKMTSTLTTTPQTVTSTTPLKPTTSTYITATREIILQKSQTTTAPKLQHAFVYESSHDHGNSLAEGNLHHSPTSENERVFIKVDTTDRLPRFQKEYHSEYKGHEFDVDETESHGKEPLNRESHDIVPHDREREKSFEDKESRNRDEDDKLLLRDKEINSKSSRDQNNESRDQNNDSHDHNSESRDKDFHDKELHDKEVENEKTQHSESTMDKLREKEKESENHQEQRNNDKESRDHDKESHDKEFESLKHDKEDDMKLREKIYDERKKESNDDRFRDDKENYRHMHDKYDDRNDDIHFDERERKHHGNIDVERDEEDRHRFEEIRPTHESDDNLYKSKFDHAFHEDYNDAKMDDYHYKNYKNHDDDRFDHRDTPTDYNRPNGMSDPFEGDYKNDRHNDNFRERDHGYDDENEKPHHFGIEKDTHDYPTTRHGHSYHDEIDDHDYKMEKERVKENHRAQSDNGVKIHVNVITPDGENPTKAVSTESINLDNEKDGNPIKTGTQRSGEMENETSDKNDMQPTRININLHLKEEGEEENEKNEEDKPIDLSRKKQDSVVTLPIDIVPTHSGRDNLKDIAGNNPSHVRISLDHKNAATVPSQQQSIPTDHITPEMLKESLKDAFRDLAKENFNEEKAKKLVAPIPYKSNKPKPESINKNFMQNWHNNNPVYDQMNGPFLFQHSPSLRSSLTPTEKPVKSKNNTGTTNIPSPYQESPTRRKSRLEHEEDDEEKKLKEQKKNDGNKPTKEIKTNIPKSYDVYHDSRSYQGNYSEACNCEATSPTCHCKRIKPTISENSQRRQDATFPPQLNQDCFPPNSPACHFVPPMLQSAIPYEQSNVQYNQEQYNPAVASFATAVQPYQQPFLNPMQTTTAKSMLPNDKIPQIQYPNPIMHLPFPPSIPLPGHSGENTMPGIQFAVQGSTFIPQQMNTENCNGGFCSCPNPPCFPQPNQPASIYPVAQPFQQNNEPLLQTGGSMNFDCSNPPCLPDQQQQQQQQQFQPQQQQLQPQLQTGGSITTTPPYCDGTPCFYDPLVEQCLHPPCPPELLQQHTSSSNMNHMSNQYTQNSQQQSPSCQCSASDPLCQCYDQSHVNALQQHQPPMEPQHPQTACANPPCYHTCFNPPCFPIPPPAPPPPPPPPPPCPPDPCLPPCKIPPDCTPNPVRILIKKLPEPKKLIKVIEKPPPPKFILTTQAQPSPPPKIIFIKAPEPAPPPPPPLPPPPPPQIPEPFPLPPPQPRIILAQQAPPMPPPPPPPLAPPRRIYIQQTAPQMNVPPPQRVVYAMPQQVQPSPPQVNTIQAAPPPPPVVQQAPHINSDELLKSISSLLARSTAKVSSPQIQVPVQAQVTPQMQLPINIPQQQFAPQSFTPQSFTSTSINSAPISANAISLPIKTQGIQANIAPMQPQVQENPVNVIQIPNRVTAPKVTNNKVVVAQKQTYSRPMISSFMNQKPNFKNNNFNDRQPMGFMRPNRKPIWNPDIYSRQPDLSLNCFQNPNQFGCQGGSFQMRLNRNKNRNPDGIERLVKGMSQKAEDQGEMSPDIEDRISDAVAEAIVEAKKNFQKQKSKKNNGKENFRNTQNIDESGLVRNYIASASGALLPYYDMLMKARKDLAMIKPNREQNTVGLVHNNLPQTTMQMPGPFTSVASLNNAKASDIKAEIFNRFLKNKQETKPVFQNYNDRSILNALQLPHFQNNFKRTTKSTIEKAVQPSHKRSNLTEYLKLADKLKDESLLNHEQKKIVASIARTVASVQTQLGKKLKYNLEPQRQSNWFSPLPYTDHKPRNTQSSLKNVSKPAEKPKYAKPDDQKGIPFDRPSVNYVQAESPYSDQNEKHKKFNYLNLVPIRAHSLSLKANMTNSLPVSENTISQLRFKNQSSTARSVNKDIPHATHIIAKPSENLFFKSTTPTSAKIKSLTHTSKAAHKKPIEKNNQEFDFSNIHVTGPSNIGAFAVKKQPIKFEHLKDNKNKQNDWPIFRQSRTTIKTLYPIKTKQVNKNNALQSASSIFSKPMPYINNNFQNGVPYPMAMPKIMNINFSKIPNKSTSSKKLVSKNFLSELSDSALLMLNERLKSEANRLNPSKIPSKKTFERKPQEYWYNKEHMRNALTTKYGNQWKNFEHILLKKSKVNIEPPRKYLQVQYDLNDYNKNQRLKPTLKRFFKAHRKLITKDKITRNIIIDVENGINDITKELNKRHKSKSRKILRQKNRKKTKSKNIRNKDVIKINITDD